MELFKLLEQNDDFKKALSKWDNWDYILISPSSLDDEPHMILHLKNKDRTRQRLQISYVITEVKVTNDPEVKEDKLI